MADILEGTILDPVENAVAYLGDMGLPVGTPLNRFVLGTAGGAILMFAWKPQFAFDANGNPLQWAVSAPAGAKDTTAMPWWLFSLVSGTFFGVLI